MEKEREKKLNNLTKILLFILVIFSIDVVSPIFVFSEESVPLINEVMSSNQTTIQDEDGDYSDWIEIYNPGDLSIDLTGYGLSDRPDNPYKWVFSQVIIDPGIHMLVFASGKDRKEISNHWETVIIKEMNGGIVLAVLKFQKTGILLNLMIPNGSQVSVELVPELIMQRLFNNPDHSIFEKHLILMILKIFLTVSCI